MKRPTLCTLLLAPILFLVSCESTPQSPKLPPLDVASLAQQGTPLSVALVAAEQIRDIHSKIYAYTEIARGYIATGSPDKAFALIDRILRITDLLKLTQDSADIQSVAAGLLVQAGDVQRAVGLLQTALANVQYVKDDTNRGIVLEKIIAACFTAGPAAYDVLRQTIQAVYVIQDLWVRASVLLDTARRYEESGNTQPVNLLLQQAIPAAGSIASPWLKAEALSQIAVRFASIGNSDSSQYYSSRSLDQITSVTVVRRSEEDASRVLQVAANLARLGMVDQAVRVLQTVEYVYLRASGLADVARIIHGLNAGQNRNRALVLCARAVDLAQTVSDPYRQAEALAAIGEAYGEIGQPRLALATAGVAESALSHIVNVAQRSAAVDAVAKLELRWGNADHALGLVSSIDDAYSRASTMITLADFLVGQKDRANAATAIRIAEADAARASYLRDNLYRAIALDRVKLGDYVSALADISRMSDPYPIATTLAELGASLRPDTVLSVSAGDALRSIAVAVLHGTAAETPLPTTPQTGGAGQTPPSGQTEGTAEGGQGL